MEKAFYSGDCELKTRTVYQQGCYFPTMLHIQELCCKRVKEGHYPVMLYTNYDFFIMDDEQRLKSELEERYVCIGETDNHLLCHLVQTVPLFVCSKPIRERVYKGGEFISDYSTIDDEFISDNQKQFIPGELVFVLKEDSLTVGVITTCSVNSKSYQLLVIGADRECQEVLEPISRVLKYRDMLEHIDVATVYKLKKQLYQLNDAPTDAAIPMWLGWNFIETTCKAEEFGMMVYTVPIPCIHANKILGKEIELSNDGWHYRVVGDNSKEEKMLWGYMNKSVTNDNMPFYCIEKIIQDEFPIGFNGRLSRLKNLLFTNNCNNGQSIEHRRAIINRFIIGYNEGIRQMSQNNLDLLAEQISMMEEQFANGEYLPEQKENMQSTIENGKRIMGQLKIIKSFQPCIQYEKQHNE